MLRIEFLRIGSKVIRGKERRTYRVEVRVNSALIAREVVEGHDPETGWRALVKRFAASKAKA